MKQVDVNKLKKGNKIIHSRYGLCSVVELIMTFGNFFGITLVPETENGKIQLAADSGTTIPRFLEGSIKRIKPAPAENAEAKAN
jgi:hypothetical protein